MLRVRPLLPSRPSSRDRERVAQRLRVACEQDRLSVDTFVHRLGIAYGARSREELDALVVDLHDEHGLAQALVAVTASFSTLSARLADAWRHGRSQRLVLPRAEAVRLGRSRHSDCVVLDQTVSRDHAVLLQRDGAWWLRDLRSTNGTFVNGLRVADEAQVRPGDEIRLGAARFVLAPPSP